MNTSILLLNRLSLTDFQNRPKYCLSTQDLTLECNHLANDYVTAVLTVLMAVTHSNVRDALLVAASELRPSKGVVGATFV